MTALRRSTRVLAAGCAVLAALAVPAHAGPVARDAIAERRASSDPTPTAGEAPSASAPLPLPSLPSALTTVPPPRLLLERCLGLDRGELRRALERELSSLTVRNALVVTAICEDAVYATVRVSYAGEGRTLGSERQIALGEVATEFRTRLLALVAVELAESMPPLPAPAPYVPPAPPAPAPALVAAIEPAASAALEVRDRASPLAPRRAPATSSLGDPPQKRYFGTAIRPGMRIYREVSQALITLGAELDTPVAALGAVGGIGPTFSAEGGPYLPELGRILPFFYAITARRELYCLPWAVHTVCLKGGLEVGRAGIDIAFIEGRETPIERRANYTMISAALDWRTSLPKFDAGAWLDFGWSDGARYYDGDEFFSYDGLVISAGVMVGWPR